MKSNTKSLIRNTIVTVCLLSTASIFGLLFYSKLIGSVDSFEKQPVIGDIIEIQGNVERRYHKQNSWNKFSNDEILYNLDAIRTADQASALIVLKYTDEEGNEKTDEIHLGSDTYLVFDISEKSRNINFIDGQIDASSTDGLVIISDNTLIDVNENASIGLVRNVGESLDISVSEGTASVDVDGEKTNIGTESSFYVDETSGQAVEQQIFARTISPQNHQVLISYEEPLDVTFSWEILDESPTSILEVAPNKAFTTGETQQIKASDNANVNLSAGTWYWRIVNDTSGETSNINVLTVGIESNIKAISPASDITLPLIGESSQTMIQWTPTNYADSYLLEIAPTADFLNPQISQSIRKTSYLSKNLPAGQWWWRVIPQYSREKIDRVVEMPPQRFYLEERIEHAQVKLVIPDNKTSIPKSVAIAGVDFRWIDQPTVLAYNISVASDPNFDQIVAVTNTQQNWAKLLPNPSPGTYYWRVNATSSDGLAIPNSPVYSFEVEPITKTIDLVFPVPNEDVVFEPYAYQTFRWNSQLKGTTRFILQKISGNQATTVMESLVQGESLTTFLPGESDYSWKVELLDDIGQVIMESLPAKFTIKQSLNSPTLLSPNPDEGLTLIGSEKLLISWTPISIADTYRLVLKNATGRIVAERPSIETPFLELSLPSWTQPGNYFIELQSIRNKPNAPREISNAKRYEFTIAQIVRYTPTQLQTPANNTVFEAHVPYTDGIEFTWQKNQIYSRWTLELTRNSITRLYQATEPTLRLNGIEAGDYTWIIRSWDQFGEEGPKSTERRFTIQEFLTPSPPVVTFPKTNQKIDATSVTTLNFEWNEVEGASYYNLEIYSLSTGLLAIQQLKLEQPSFTLNNLKLLNVGLFRLEVTAIAVDDKTSILKTSSVSRVPFSIIVNIPKVAPKILSKERQYVE